MVDLGLPEPLQSGDQGCFYYDTADPGWVAAEPWGRHDPFYELHGLRKIQSAPAWLPLTWSLRPVMHYMLPSTWGLRQRLGLVLKAWVLICSRKA